MPDYGHDLQFDFFLDDLGYDLIGIHAWSQQIDHNDNAFSACCRGFNRLMSMQVCDLL
jgi:hypothetical protein